MLLRLSDVCPLTNNMPVCCLPRDECRYASASLAAELICVALIRSELLRGPLYYVIVLLIATVAAWRMSPVPIVALAFMCGGDGLADIAGRNIGGPKLPNNSRKTWAGSIAMLLGNPCHSVSCWLCPVMCLWPQLQANALAPSSSSSSSRAELVLAHLFQCYIKLEQHI